MKIKEGGAISILCADKDEILETVQVFFDENIQLWLNGRMLSYLSLCEAIDLRNELNKTIKEAAGIIEI